MSERLLTRIRKLNWVLSESTTGYMLLGIVIILFIMYAYLLQKIIKVEY